LSFLRNAYINKNLSTLKYGFAKIVQIFHAQQVGSGLGSESGSAALDADPDVKCGEMLRIHGTYYKNFEVALPARSLLTGIQ
jgi:hypothetical protein